MGFSTAAAQVIFFIAVVTISAGLVTVFGNYVDQAKGSMGDKQRQLSGQLKTQVEITNVYYDSGTTPDTILIYAKNTGDKVLDTECIDLFLDDDWVTLLGTDITDPDNGQTTDEWNLEDTIRLNATQNLAQGNHEVKIVTCNGVTDTFEFSN